MLEGTSKGGGDTAVLTRDIFRSSREVVGRVDDTWGQAPVALLSIFTLEHTFRGTETGTYLSSGQGIVHVIPFDSDLEHAGLNEEISEWKAQANSAFWAVEDLLEEDGDG